METTEIYTIEWSYFSDKYATEYHLRILRLRYKWTSYLKPLTTYFQNVHLQCKNNRLLENKSSADIYIEGIKDTEKKLWEWCKKEKKIQKEMEKRFNKLTEVN